MTKLKLDGTIRPWEKGYAPQFVNFSPQSKDYRLVGDIFAKSVGKFGDRTAFSLVLQSGDCVEKTYKEIDTHVDALARYFKNHLKLKPGDVIAIQLPNSLHYPIAVFAAFKAGLIVTNINPLYTPREIIYQLKDSGAKALIGFVLFADRLEQVAKEVNLKATIIAAPWEFFPFLTSNKLKFFMTKVRKMVPAADIAYTSFSKALAIGEKSGNCDCDLNNIDPDDPAFLQYTGGTTGVSKGVELSHKNVISVLEMVSDYSAEYRVEGRQNTILTVIPFYHIFALIMNMMLFTSIGGRNILIPNPNPLTNLQPAFEKYSFDWFTGVETMFSGLLHETWFKQNPPEIGLAVGGGAALRPETQATWQNTVGQMVEGYGLTETTCLVSFNNSNDALTNGSVGRPLPGLDIKILDGDGKPVGFDEAGQLWVRGANIAARYHNHRDEAFKNGWFATGDIVTMDEDGLMTIVDREKDMILVSGFNVYPNELEKVISELDGVLDVAVVGIDHNKRGEAPKAFIVRSNPNLGQEDVIAHCREHLTAYKIPVEIEFRDSLPKSPVGKILRKMLRKS